MISFFILRTIRKLALGNGWLPKEVGLSTWPIKLASFFILISVILYHNFLVTLVQKIFEAFRHIHITTETAGKVVVCMQDNCLTQFPVVVYEATFIPRNVCNMKNPAQLIECIYVGLIQGMIDLCNGLTQSLSQLWYLRLLDAGFQSQDLTMINAKYDFKYMQVILSLSFFTFVQQSCVGQFQGLNFANQNIVAYKNLNPQSNVNIQLLGPMSIQGYIALC